MCRCNHPNLRRSPFILPQQNVHAISSPIYTQKRGTARQLEWRSVNYLQITENDENPHKRKKEADVYEDESDDTEGNLTGV